MAKFKDPLTIEEASAALVDADRRRIEAMKRFNAAENERAAASAALDAASRDYGRAQDDLSNAIVRETELALGLDTVDRLDEWAQS